MKVAVVGAGSIGLLITYYLAQKGVDPLLITRREGQAQQVNQYGIHMIDHNGEKDVVYVQAAPIDKVIAHEQVDIVLLAVKSYQLKDVLEEVRKLHAHSLVFLQNGMGHVDVFEQLDVGDIAVAVIEHGAFRQNDYTVVHTGVGQMRWSYVRNASTCVEQLATIAAAKHFPVKKEGNWRIMLETKLIVNTCINPLTAIFNVKNGELIKNRHYTAMMRAVFEETVSILGKTECDTLWELVSSVCKKTAENRSSMLVDIEKRHETEIESILGYLLKKGKEERKKTELLHFLYHGVKAREGN